MANCDVDNEGICMVFKLYRNDYRRRHMFLAKSQTPVFLQREQRQNKRVYIFVDPDANNYDYAESHTDSHRCHYVMSFPTTREVRRWLGRMFNERQPFG